MLKTVGTSPKLFETTGPVSLPLRPFDSAAILRIRLMEFNYGPIGEQALQYVARSSNYSYFTEQAIQERHSGQPADNFRNRSDLREALLIELEKERIRREIIAAEIDRKRALAEELRRGQQIAAQRDQLALLRIREANNSFPSLESNWSLPEDTTGTSLENRFATRAAARHGGGVEGFETVPFYYRRY